MHQHLKIKELVAAANKAAPGLPPAAAQLMREVATRLDVTLVALSEALDQRGTARADGLDEMAGAYRMWANKDDCSHNMQCSYRLTAERAESYAAYIRKELRAGGSSDEQ